jgi:hypothetical protein
MALGIADELKFYYCQHSRSSGCSASRDDTWF